MSTHSPPVCILSLASTGAGFEPASDSFRNDDVGAGVADWTMDDLSFELTYHYFQCPVCYNLINTPDRP